MTTPKAPDGHSALAWQGRVNKWVHACFGPEIAADKVERNHRFLEEALELVQAAGCAKGEALQLVEYVYGRPDGDISQEVGGAIVTLTALCSAHKLSLEECAETELARIWGKIEAIRAKQAAKPAHSPLPEAVNAHPTLTARIEELEGALRACHQQMREWDDAMDLDLRSDAEIQKWCEARERARTALENRK